MREETKKNILMSLPLIVVLLVVYLCLWFFDPGFADWVKSLF